MKKGLLIIVLLMLFTLFGCEMPTGSNTPKKESYEIDYILNGGAFVETPKEKYSKGEEYTFPTPVYEDHEFLGWFDKLTDEERTGIAKTDTGDIKVYAKWEESEVYSTIGYMLNGGSFVEAPKESYTPGEEYTFPTPVYEKHQFLGWFDMITDEERTGITKTDTGDIRVYAKWEKLDVYCTITYHTNGGVLPDGAPTSYKEGDYVGLVRSTREGYLFRGWYKDSAFTKAYNVISKEDTGDVEIYAKWDEFKMENIRFGILGDSISTYYDQFDSNSSIFSGDNQFYYPKYCSTVTSSSMCWWMKAINRLGATMMINNSYSGGTVLGSGMSSALNDQRLLKFLKNNEYPDITFILLGVNDALGGSSKATFKDGYEKMLNKLMRYYPGMQLFICLLPYETYSDGVYRELYNEALREIATEYQLPIVDFTTAWNSTTEQKNNWYYLNDNIHPNDKGMAVMGNIAYQAVIDYYHLGE